MTQHAARRTVVRFDNATFQPMTAFGDRDGVMQWHNVSFDECKGAGSYLLIMEPGASSVPHRHDGREEFFVLDGELVEFDGTVYRAGDFVSLAAGTAHTSLSPSGCKLLVTAWGPTEPVAVNKLEPLS